MFALTMTGDNDKPDVQLHNMRTRSVQIDLTQMAIQTKLDTIVARLDAITTALTELRKDYDSDTEQDDSVDGNRRGRARHVVCPPANDSFTKIQFTIPSYNGKYNPAAYLDWEIEVERNFLCYDIPASAQVKTAISAFTDFALIWWREYKLKHPATIPTTWAQLKAAMRHRFVPSFAV